MKEFYTYEQQIEKIKNDGLIITDENQVRECLRLEGYYNIIKGYSPIFKNNNKYYKGTTFNNIKALYDFDKSLRNMIYRYISSIEVHIKALIAHEFSRVHGIDEKQYLRPESFNNTDASSKAVERLIQDCNDTIEAAKNKTSNKYREYIAYNFGKNKQIPLWILIRALTFGTTSIFYKNMLESEKTIIADNYKITAANLSNILEVVVSFRNIVAHGERTFCARLPKTRLSTKLSITKKLNIPKNNNNENKFGRNDMLSLLICCKYLLQPLEFAGLITELESYLDTLSKSQTPSMLGKIKIAMGLSNNSWKLLPKLKV